MRIPGKALGWDRLDTHNVWGSRSECTQNTGGLAEAPKLGKANRAQVKVRASARFRRSEVGSVWGRGGPDQRALADSRWRAGSRPMGGDSGWPERAPPIDRGSHDSPTPRPSPTRGPVGSTPGGSIHAQVAASGPQRPPPSKPANQLATAPVAASFAPSGWFPLGGAPLPAGAGALPDGAGAIPDGAGAIPDGAGALPDGADPVPCRRRPAPAPPAPIRRCGSRYGSRNH